MCGASASRPARRGQDLHAPRALTFSLGQHLPALAQPIHHAFDAVRQDRNQDLVGHVRLATTAVAVVLAQETADDLVVGYLDAPVRVAAEIDHPPTADHHQRQLDELALAVQSEHVLIAARDLRDALSLVHALHRR